MEIIREESPLVRHVFRWDVTAPLSGLPVAVSLREYRRETRLTTRHKFRASALGQWTLFGNRYATLTRAQVPITQADIEAARAQVVASIVMNLSESHPTT